jgi:hypothetical protein
LRDTVRTGPERRHEENPRRQPVKDLDAKGDGLAIKGGSLANSCCTGSHIKEATLVVAARL